MKMLSSMYDMEHGSISSISRMPLTKKDTITTAHPR